MPSFTDTSFILAVENPDRSAEYYREVLGFSYSTLDLGPGWSVVERDNCRICLGACGDSDDWIPASSIPYHSWFAYVVVDDLDGYHEQVREKGGDIVKELSTNPSGSRDFSVRTIDGHGIMFGTGE